MNWLVSENVQLLYREPDPDRSPRVPSAPFVDQLAPRLGYEASVRVQKHGISVPWLRQTVVLCGEDARCPDYPVERRLGHRVEINAPAERDARHLDPLGRSASAAGELEVASVRRHLRRSDIGRSISKIAQAIM